MNYLARSSIATCLIAAVWTIAATTIGAAESEDFPHHTIKIVVPVPPGPLLDVVPRIIAECGDFPAVLAMVAAGIGVSLMPRMAVRHIPPGVVHGHVNDDPARRARLLFITNWPLLNHLGITNFVQLTEKPRAARRRAR